MRFDVIVVLGGSKKYGILKSRLDKCVEIFSKKVAKNIIVSCGGHSSKFMKNYLTSMGIPEKDVYEETHAADTFGNAFFTKLLFLIPKKWKKVAIVTSDYHAKRTNFVFRKVLGKTYKLKIFQAKTKVDPLTWDELVFHEDLSLTSEKILLNNFHLVLIRDQN